MVRLAGRPSLVARELLGEEGHREALPGEIWVTRQQSQRLAGAPQPLDLRAEGLEPGGQIRP